MVGSCGKKKKSTHPNAPTCEEIQSKNDLSQWQQELEGMCHPAREMYTGNQNRELVKGVDLLRKIEDSLVHLYIISAGFGFLAEEELVPPYDCTFSGMNKQSILARASRLSIPHDFMEQCAGRYDLYYLALGSDYYTALGQDWKRGETGCIIQFVEKNASSNQVWFPSGNDIVRALSARGHKIHGAAGFKGDLLRILANQALKQEDPYGELVGWTEPSYLHLLFSSLAKSGQSTLFH